MRTRRPARLVVAVVAALIAVSCSGDDEPSSRPTDSETPAPAEATAPTDAATSPSAPAETMPPETMPAETMPPEMMPAETAAASGADAAFAAIGPVVDEYLTANDMNGAGLVVVDRDDGIVHSEYWGDFDAERRSFIASSSKMITAGVLMKLADDGLLDIDAPVADAVPWGSGNPDITPAQLVSNSSGLVGLDPNPAYSPYLCQFVADSELQACAEAVFTTPDDDARVVPPDTEFRYGGAQWQVAGGVAEAVSGSTWDELIDEIYVRPCGVDSLAYNNHWASAPLFDYPRGTDPSSLPPTDNPHMGAGVYIDAPDYAELLLMHLRGGECPGGRVMSSDAIDRLHADRTLAAYPDGIGAAAPGYGMGWWIDRETGRISDGGAYGSVPWLDLAAGYGAYLVVEATSPLGRGLSALIEPLIDDAIATYRAG